MKTDEELKRDCDESVTPDPDYPPLLSPRYELIFAESASKGDRKPKQAEESRTKKAKLLHKNLQLALDASKRWYADRESAAKGDPNQPRDDHGRWTTTGGGSPGKGEMNIDSAVAHLDKYADPAPPGKRECAIYVRRAIEAGGVKLEKHPEPARLYSPYLDKYFDRVTPLPEPGDSPKKGDIAVFQPPINEDDDGHIQMYNGTQWVSDFKQPNGFWPGKDYRNIKPHYAIYRPKDWKPKP
jgi:hypothetical protein